MRVLITGATGLVGSALAASLAAQGHTVVRLVRSKPRPEADEVPWDPEAGTLDMAGLEGVDAAVHLAGESISAGRWTARKKARIRDSRIRGTSLLSDSLARLPQPPKVLACASAMGYYGDRGDEVLTEESASGSGFLAEVARQWESATEPAAQGGIRVANLRFGLVLSRKGGALGRMLLPFRLGLGGRLGSGRQYWSWVTLDDTVGAICHALTTDGLRGPVNVAAPHPVTNREFTRTLGRVLRRPALLPTPALLLRLVLGEMAGELVLPSIRMEPARLVASGYRFRFPELEEALRHTLRGASP